MIVYGSRSVAVDVPAFLHTCTARVAARSSPASHDALVDLLVDFGEVESAVADACLPDRDEDDPQLIPWLTAGQAIADALYATDAGDRRRAAAALRELAGALDVLHASNTPSTVQTKTAEGFAHYGLFPDSYAHAADCLAETFKPARVVCLGIRSIGAPLAHVVAATLSRRGIAADVRTFRPRGHPFDRCVILGGTMRDWIRRQADALFIVVDEGPGLSGTSFAAAIDALTTCGVEGDRIVLMPSWDAPAERLRSERARDRWRSHRRFVAVDRHQYAGDDVSAGAWRRALIADEAAWPAVQPQHERRKIGITARLKPWRGLRGLAGRDARSWRARKCLPTPDSALNRSASRTDSSSSNGCRALHSRTRHLGLTKYFAARRTTQR